jgi:hypothetical protein
MKSVHIRVGVLLFRGLRSEAVDGKLVVVIIPHECMLCSAKCVDFLHLIDVVQESNSWAKTMTWCHARLCRLLAFIKSYHDTPSRGQSSHNDSP